MKILAVIMRWKLSWLEILEPGPDGAALEELVAELLHLAAAACKSIVWSIVPRLRSWHFICDMKQGDVQFRGCVTSWRWPDSDIWPAALRRPPHETCHACPRSRGRSHFCGGCDFCSNFTKVRLFQGEPPLIAPFAPRIAFTAADWIESLCR